MNELNNNQPASMDVELSPWELQMKIHGVQKIDNIHCYSLWASDYDMYLISVELPSHLGGFLDSQKEFGLDALLRRYFLQSDSVNAC